MDSNLQEIMKNIFYASFDASITAGKEGNLIVGANCTGFLKVATAMIAQGVTY